MRTILNDGLRVKIEIIIGHTWNGYTARNSLRKDREYNKFDVAADGKTAVRTSLKGGDGGGIDATNDGELSTKSIDSMLKAG